MELYERLDLVCREKYTSLKEFADDMGVSSSYMCNLLKGKFSCGTKPVMWVIEHHPDIDARWLLTGQGTIYGSEENYIHHVIQRLIELEKYVCVMNADDIRYFIDGMNSFDVHFPPLVMKRLKKDYQEKYGKRDSELENAMKKNLDTIKEKQVEKD